MHSPITRPAVPAVADLHLAEDRYVTHDVAELKLAHATGTVRRHVDPDGDITFSGRVEADTSADWIDDTTTAGDTAQAWAFVVAELDSARAEHQRAIFAAKEHHPAGTALGGAQ
ncbi:hypothetical protein JF732_18925 [Mycobacterium intracellulare]|uniref:Uncharacterized protein n=1 Tax=Mycobacterium intracellulare TaxID=1767 RepID=A0AAE4UEK8_MYCIT|nr:hypothetical protein [Mycobacterium intracellulare]ETZ31160.1 hypothetical protein L842_2221 [Mycobacterium intracellulare MIN_052511_1280]MCA2320688.1 hypothetical protein [Mycobacterium intracellulare]MCA2342616.1 hypothetical protein [Mycobacterium intracellulare]MDV6978202.1 hypothetical protein [Mycobacterium intracellulare]MDV6983597.1 hypothetical protein [Mycobacterium intracellulare]